MIWRVSWVAAGEGGAFCANAMQGAQKNNGKTPWQRNLTLVTIFATLAPSHWQARQKGLSHCSPPAAMVVIVSPFARCRSLAYQGDQFVPHRSR
jgi:hypothetical protein